MKWIVWLFGLVVAAPASAATVPPPPQVLAPYIKDGKFDPGDYAWMRGEFADASAEEKAAAKAINEWLNACWKAGRVDAIAQLKAMGVANPALDNAPMASPLCSAVSWRPFPKAFASYAAFKQAVAEGVPIGDSFLMAVRIAEEAGGSKSGTQTEALMAKPLGEQKLRRGLGWGEGDQKDAPKLSPEVKAVVIARLSAALAERDRANTDWLKAMVAKNGWPRKSVVGAQAPRQAWLLAQHADADPAF